MAHICVGNLTIIGSDNGLSPGRRQAIIWANAGILLIGPWGTNFSEILIGIQTFSFKKMHLKMSSAKLRPFCLGLNVLKQHIYIGILSEWISEKFSCLFTTITWLRKISLLLFCDSHYKILYKTDFMIMQWFNFTIKISYSMKYLFIIPCCDYFDSEQSSGQMICTKRVHTAYIVNSCCPTAELITEVFSTFIVLLFQYLTLFKNAALKSVSLFASFK